MAGYLRLDSVNFSYKDYNYDEIYTGKYFIPSGEMPVEGNINITFTPLDYVVRPSDLEFIQIYLYCDNIEILRQDTGFIWNAVNNDTINNIPSGLNPNPITVSVDLEAFTNKENLLSPGNHEIKIKILGGTKSSYDGLVAPPNWFSDNSITVKSMHKIIRYDSELSEQLCIMRVYNNSEWKFAQCKNVIPDTIITH